MTGSLSVRHDRPELRQLMAEPDAFFERPEIRIIKDNRRSRVGHGLIDGTEIVVKSVRARSRAKALKRAFAPTPAARAWRSAWRLRAMGIPTPEPIAYVERRRGPFRGASWLVSAYVDGLDAPAFFRATPSLELQRATIERIAALLQSLHQAAISHGDNNLRNFVIADGEPYLVDLDSMFFHPVWSPVRRRYICRDLRRLAHNARRFPHAHELFLDALGLGAAARHV